MLFQTPVPTMAGNSHVVLGNAVVEPGAVVVELFTAVVAPRAMQSLWRSVAACTGVEK